MKERSTFHEGSVRTDSGARVEKLMADPAKVHFICEQDGVPERELKERLVKVFDNQEAVDLAYLATIQYSDEDDYSVALCLRRKMS
jgi:hypothetical protein